MRVFGRVVKGQPPKIGEWVSTDDHYPPCGEWVLGWWDAGDLEACCVQCRGAGKREEDWWWETRGGDTAAPAAWAPITEGKT
jgi:hypothetical protein